MPLGIKLTVDFAFKKVFGSPEYSAALIGLLNAILGSVSPIVAVEILNPFSYQEFKNDHFVLIDELSGRRIAKSIEVYTIELPKYNLSEDTLSTAEKLEQWVFLLLRAQEASTCARIRSPANELTDLLITLQHRLRARDA